MNVTATMEDANIHAQTLQVLSTVRVELDILSAQTGAIAMISMNAPLVIHAPVIVSTPLGLFGAHVEGTKRTIQYLIDVSLQITVPVVLANINVLVVARPTTVTACQGTI